LIESAPWTAHKCEAIDPKSDFWWIDDDPSAHDRDWLRAHGCEDRLIEIGTDTYPDALTQLIRFLESGWRGKISPGLIFTASTRRMGPVKDRAPPVYR